MIKAEAVAVCLYLVAHTKEVFFWVKIITAKLILLFVFSYKTSKYDPLCSENVKLAMRNLD